MNNPPNRTVYDLLKKRRYERICSMLGSKTLTILDAGSEGNYLKELIQNSHVKVTAMDIDPKRKDVIKGDIMALPFEDKKYDAVVCSQVLEHLENPIAAIAELKRVAKKQIIITVPNEPYFTLFRLGCWEKEHLWAITPRALKALLGSPAREGYIFFKRYYIAMWELSNQDR